MISLRKVIFFAVAIELPSTIGATILGRFHDGGIDLEARHETVTVTVTANTCGGYGSAPPSVFSSSVPVSVPATSITTATPAMPSASDSYFPPPLISTGSTAAITPKIESTASPPVATATTGVLSSTLSSVTTPTHSFVPAVPYPTVGTMSVTTNTASNYHPSTTPTVSVSIPPAVGQAGKVVVNAGAFALLAVAALY